MPSKKIQKLKTHVVVMYERMYRNVHFKDGAHFKDGTEN